VKDRIPDDQHRLDQLLSEAQAANLRLTATVSFLEEQNRVLMGENAALSESLSVFIRTGSGAPSSQPSSPVSIQESEALKEATALLKEKSSASGTEEGGWLWASDLSGRVDAFVGSLAGRRVRGRRTKRNILMLNAIESLASLVHLSTTLAGAEDAAEAVADEAEEVDGGGDDGRARELDISLKHSLFEATHILCEVLLDPSGRETSELLEPFPNQWLLNSFPFPRVPAPPSSISTPSSPAVVVSAGIGKGADCWLPLHWCAAARDPDPINIEVLSDELAPAVFAHSVSPLSIAVAKGRPSFAVVAALVQRNRDLLSLCDEDGSVPLMHACSCNEDAEVVQFLYETNPSSLVAQDKAGFRAINYAGGASGFFLRCTRFLPFYSHPPSLSLSAYSGYCPVVGFLLSAQPKVAGMASKNGSLALHDAAENGLRGGLSMVAEVFQANTSALLQADDDGALPMHRAARGGSLEVVQFLHGLFPKALTMEDREGLLPLHYASQRGDRDQDENLKIVQYLVQKT
jgi:ankyrin repeat protein